MIAVIVVLAGMPVPVIAVPTEKLAELVSVRLFVPFAPAVDVETGAARRVPCRTRVPAPVLVRPPVMLPLDGLRVRVPAALETSMAPVVMLSGRVEVPLTPEKRRVPPLARERPVAVPRPIELPIVSAMVLASRMPPLTVVMPVYVLRPERTRVPAPFLVRAKVPPEGFAMTLESVNGAVAFWVLKPKVLVPAPPE